MAKVKGGITCEVITGKRTGLFAMVPNSKQEQKFLDVGKVYVEYFHDHLGQKPLIEDGKHICGVTAFSNLKIIGYYD